MQEEQEKFDYLDEYKYGFSMPEKSYLRTEMGLDEEIIRKISEMKKEPQWMLNYRLNAFKEFEKMAMPNWGADLSKLDFKKIHYYCKPVAESEARKSWDDVPSEIKETFDRLGIPEAERQHLAGVGAQYDSEMIYHSIRKDLEEKGVIFCDPETAVRDYPDLVKEYFGTIVPFNDNKFAALNAAVWSGGSFVYVPKGVKVDIPIQAYFRINSENMGQFERTLIIAEEDSFIHYIEGCTAPAYSTSSLHSAVVEIIVKKGARVKYSTVQNWSLNVFNLVTKRAYVLEKGTMEWVDGNIGSAVTMKYPAVILAGEGAHGEVTSIAFAKDFQHQDTGAKMVHLADNTTSVITSKSISKGSGIASYRGLVKATSGLKGIKSKVECDALLLNSNSETRTYPYMEIETSDASIEHEATVSKIGDDKLMYLQSRGLSEEEASMMIVNGFVDPLVKALPLEYAVELNRLIELEMEGSVG